MQIGSELLCKFENMDNNTQQFLCELKTGIIRKRLKVKLYQEYKTLDVKTQAMYDKFFEDCKIRFKKIKDSNIVIAYARRQINANSLLTRN